MNCQKTRIGQNDHNLEALYTFFPHRGYVKNYAASAIKFINLRTCIYLICNGLVVDLGHKKYVMFKATINDFDKNRNFKFFPQS